MESSQLAEWCMHVRCRGGWVRPEAKPQAGTRGVSCALPGSPDQLTSEVPGVVIFGPGLGSWEPWRKCSQLRPAVCWCPTPHALHGGGCVRFLCQVPKKKGGHGMTPWEHP